MTGSPNLTPLVGEPIWQAWAVWLLPILCSPLAAVLGRLNGRARNLFAVLTGFSTSLIAASMIPFALTGYTTNLRLTPVWLRDGPLTLQIGVYIDPLSIFMANIASGIGSIVLLYSIGYMQREEGVNRYYSLMLLFIGAMTGLVMADNLAQLFIFWEIVGVCSWALIGFWYTRPSAARAGLKAFLVTRAGDACLLAGILLFYANFQALDFLGLQTKIASGLTSPGILTPCLILLFGGAMGKSAQVPFHVWLPDAMEGPTTVSALIHAATMVKAGVYLTARCSYTLVPIGSPLSSSIQAYYATVAVVGSITALLGATMAIVATDIKRVLAYSTMSQIGYMISALGFGTSLGLLASQFHVLSHALFKALLFLCAGAVIHSVGTTDMGRLGGLRRRMPITFAASTIGILALAGVPPLSGFWSKDMIISSSLQAGFYASTALLVLTSAITIAYGLRWSHRTFLYQSTNTPVAHAHDPPLTMQIPVIILAVLSCFIGVLEEPLAEFMGISYPRQFDASAFALALLALVAGGILTYLAYHSKQLLMQRLQAGVLRKVGRVVASGYYFDLANDVIFVKGTAQITGKLILPLESLLGAIPDLVGRAGLRVANDTRGLVDKGLDRLTYAVAEGTIRMARGVRRYAEAGLDYLTYATAEGTLRSARSIHQYTDESLDRLTYLIAEGTIKQGKVIRKTHTGSIQLYVLAAVIGLTVLTLLTLLTAG